MDVAFNAFTVRGHSICDCTGNPVSAHPHGLAQCTRFIAEHHLQPEPASSNAAACRDLKPGRVALGPSICGELYDLDTLAEHVQDFDGAHTEFLVIAPRDVVQELNARAHSNDAGDFETIITFIPLVTGPGVLADLLDVLRDAGLNMTSFISRPIKGHDGTYSFIATLDAAPWEPRFRTALEEIAGHGDWAKTLAVYPRRERPNPPVDAGCCPRAASTSPIARRKAGSTPRKQGRNCCGRYSRNRRTRIDRRLARTPPDRARRTRHRVEPSPAPLRPGRSRWHFLQEHALRTHGCRAGCGRAVQSAQAMPSILAALAPLMGDHPNTTLTDVGSVKGMVRDQVKAAALGKCYVGAHPMAGNELSGWQAADPHLYDGALWAITVDESTDYRRFLDVAAMITKDVGNRVIVVDDETHDKAAAMISHMPHVVSTALINELVANPDRNIAAALAAGCWRDMTRVSLTDRTARARWSRKTR